MWRATADRLGLTTNQPASVEDLAAAEAAIGCGLPEDLRALLLETDGLGGAYGAEVVLSTRAIAERNREMRSPDYADLYMPFDPLLVFGADVGGDLYALRILAGEADPAVVYQWDHESDSRTAIIYGLEPYLSDPRWQE